MRGRPRKKPEEDGVSSLHKMMPFTIEEQYAPLIEKAAKKTMRSKSGYVRSLVLKDLQELGYLDENLDPIEEPRGPRVVRGGDEGLTGT